MTRRRSPSADDVPTFGRPGFVFRECAGQAQLLEFQHRRVRVLSLDRGELQIHSYRRNGEPCRADHRIDVGELDDRGAHPNRTEDGQGLLFPLDPDAPAIHQFLTRIPEDILPRVRAYPRWMQFRMLLLFVNMGATAMRLHDSGCPGFVALVAVADWLRRKPTPPESIRRWLDRPQAEVLAQLTLPGTRRVARIVRKIELTACQYPLLRHLRCLHDPRLAREISHLPRLSPLVLDAMGHLGPNHRLVTPACLREFAELEPDASQAVNVILHDRLSRHRHLEMLLGEPVPRPTFTNLKHLLRYSQLARHSELPELTNTTKIPPPPLDDERGFVSWIRTPGELLREGEAMYHCVFSYLALLMKGKAAAASVQLGEERATVIIVRGGDGSWQVRDMRLPFNKEPSAILRERFGTWLAVQTVTTPYLQGTRRTTALASHHEPE